MTDGHHHRDATPPEEAKEALRYAAQSFLVYLAASQPDPVAFLQQHRTLLVQALAQVLEESPVPGAGAMAEWHVEEAVRQSWPEVLSALSR